jgi:hypothetical protein
MLVKSVKVLASVRTFSYICIINLKTKNMNDSILIEYRIIGIAKDGTIIEIESNFLNEYDAKSSKKTYEESKEYSDYKLEIEKY